MKVVILAGGRGTRISSETETKPKALIEVGGRPILWHIMQIYTGQGFTDFVIALGYLGSSIRHYFEDAAQDGDREDAMAPQWSVELVDTGLDTASGGRLKRLSSILGRETFMMTWCDGVADIDLNRLIAFHRDHGRLATLTAVHPPPRFGELHLDGDRVAEFNEKPISRKSWINGAFFVIEPEVLDLIEGDESEWERGTLEPLARDGQLMAFRHDSYWQCMDTLKDRQQLEALWSSGSAPWRTWP